jgi:hypothetical protein
MAPIASSPQTFTNRDIADELERMGLGVYDPGYLSQLRAGSRRSSVLSPDIIAKAISNLSATNNQK